MSSEILPTLSTWRTELIENQLGLQALHIVKGGARRLVHGRTGRSSKTRNMKDISKTPTHQRSLTGRGMTP